MRIGIISDTHGLLREEVKELLRGCDAIFHAGDVCELYILRSLRRLHLSMLPGAITTGL